MKQLLIEIDDELARKLEDVAPTRTRRRSEFVRMAIRKALWEFEEIAIREAYIRQPDSAAEEWLDPETWDPAPSRPVRKRKR